MDVLLFFVSLGIYAWLLSYCVIAIGYGLCAAGSWLYYKATGLVHKWLASS